MNLKLGWCLVALCAMTTGCQRNPELEGALRGPSAARLAQVNAIYVVRGSPSASDAATSDPRLVAAMKRAVEVGISPDIPAEARRQAAMDVQGEVNLYVYRTGLRKTIATIRFDSEDLRTPRYRSEFVRAVQDIARHGEIMAVFHLRMSGMRKAEVDRLVEEARLRKAHSRFNRP